MSKKIFLSIFLIFSIKSFANIEILSDNSKEILTTPGETIELEYLIKNNLKDLKNIKTNLDLPDDFEVLNEIEKEFLLDDQKLISYSIKIPENLEKKDYQINYELLDENENKLDSYISNVHIKENPFQNTDPIKNPSLDASTPMPSSFDLAKDEIPLDVAKNSLNESPITTSFGYGLKESPDSQLFLATKGSKLLNEKLQNNFEFDLKLPLMHEGAIPKKIDGKPEKFYLGYKTPLYDVLVGDTEYKITPLTISPYSKKSDTPAPLGRGSLVTFNRKKLGLGILYLTKQPFEVSSKRDNILGFLSYKIRGNKLTSTIFNTSYKKPTLVQDKNEMTYSLRSTYDKNDSFYDVEYATNSFSTRKDAYFVKVKDKIDIFSFGVEGLYAKPKFSGYLSDTYKIDSNINFDIIKDLKATAKYKLKHTNLNKNKSLKSGDRNFSFLTKLTHEAPFKLTSNLGLESINNKDIIKTSKGYRLNKAKLNFKQPIKKFSIEPSFEKGIYRAKNERYLSRNWNRAELKLNYEPFEKQCISIYTKHGNFIDSDLYNLGHIYGAKTTVKQTDDFEISLLYEFTHYKRRTTMPLSSSTTKIKKSHKIDGSLNYTFASNHVLKLKAKLDPMKFSTKTSELALSYSIPYDVPWPKKNK
ncbi:MAG: hypothetical protein KR126chlam4_00230 [Candidatus Anoxychlamydiales bacterium]|nr:hypothetical protein [Candidatus Anoxychlamydiales bacterium]HEU63779.1 hypothetical protein [Chlamydiota bacterium]